MAGHWSLAPDVGLQRNFSRLGKTSLEVTGDWALTLASKEISADYFLFFFGPLLASLSARVVTPETIGVLVFLSYSPHFEIISVVELEVWVWIRRSKREGLSIDSGDPNGETIVWGISL